MRLNLPINFDFKLLSESPKLLACIPQKTRTERMVSSLTEEVQMAQR